MAGAGVLTGKVTRLAADGAPYAEIPRLAVGLEFGPLLNGAGVLEPGDRVLVGLLDGLVDAPVVLARVGGPRTP